MADHCRLFALSDPKEPVFQAQCDHDHEDSCDRCDQLATTFCEIESARIAQADNLLPGVNEELAFTVKQAKASESKYFCMEGSHTALYQPRFCKG